MPDLAMADPDGAEKAAATDSPAIDADLKYRRVLLKISGEALMGSQSFGIDIDACSRFANEVKSAIALGAQICLVIGGGNIFRGMTGAARGMERSQADNLGMLATVMNALAMQNALENIGVPTRVQSAIQMQQICEPFIRRRAVRHMEKGRVVIFAAGTGNPFFTTDTGAALRAAEMNCDAMFKGTQVDGVYTADPKLDADAVRYDHLDYMDVLSRELRVMDQTAITLMKENKIPIVVFSIHESGSLSEVLRGRGVSTLIDTKRT
jgi:uridylate kinase